MAEIKEIIKGYEIIEIKSLPIGEKNAILKEIEEERGISLRQAGRILDISQVLTILGRGTTDPAKPGDTTGEEKSEGLLPKTGEAISNLLLYGLLTLLFGLGVLKIKPSKNVEKL